MQKCENLKVFDARNGEKLSICEELDLFNMMGSIYVKLGLRGQNLPDKYEGTMICDYIRENLNEFTLQEIELAFNFYIANKLDYKDPVFQNFTLNFLENVMQSYKRLRMTIPRPEIQQALPEQTKPTKGEQDIIARNACLKRFQEYKDHFDVWDFGGACFKYIYRQGLIQISKEEAEQIKEQAARQLIAEAQKDLLKKRPSEIAAVVEAIQAGNDEQIKIRAMKISLMNYFDDLIEKGIELKDVLK